MVRENILNLNGPWQWDLGSGDKDNLVPPFNTTLSGTILARSRLPRLIVFFCWSVLRLFQPHELLTVVCSDSLPMQSVRQQHNQRISTWS